MDGNEDKARARFAQSDLQTDKKDTGLDLFGLNSIGKIQEDIEKALEKPQAVPENTGFMLPPETETEAVGRKLRPTENSPGFVLPTENAEIEPVTDNVIQFAPQPEAASVPAILPATEETPTTEAPAAFALPAETIQTEKMESFYRETIKEPQEIKTAPFFNSWRKVVAFLLVFTIGTGSLGFGAGFGWGFFESQNGEVYSEYGASPDSGTITTTHYVFEAAIGDPGAGSLADIVQILEPSVVTITAYFDDRFRDQTLGSGIIFAENDERIFIVTNDYVVRRSDRVAVSISGSEPLEARPVGSDPSAELNVISIYKTQLLEAGVSNVVIATFGNSDEMRVGDTVLAIGNAMGEGNSVTRGVISAPEMPIPWPNREPLMLLQTDAAINDGNSGGPLINTRGEVIGININRASNIIFGMDAVEGMGYSISSNVAMPILNNLINYRRPGLGIMGGSVDEEIATRHNIPMLGVYVSTVLEGQTAYNAGMLPSDIITGFNGLPVFYWNQLVAAIRECQIGDVVEIRVLRGGREVIVLTATIGMFVQEGF